MKKTLTCVILSILYTIVLAQGQDCAKKLESAIYLFDKEQYELAQKQFELVVIDCGEQFGGAKQYLEECTEKLNERKASLILNKSKIEFSASEESETVTITCKHCNWTYSTNYPNWISLTKAGNQLTITCDKNATDQTREGYITISSDIGNISKRIHITQIKDNLSVSYNDLRFSSNGGTQSIYVDSNINWDVDSYYYNWFDADKDGDKVRIECSPNESVDTRSGKFTIRSENGETVTVSLMQNGANVSLDIRLKSHKLEYDYGRNAQSIIVTTNYPNWTVVSSEWWCKVIKKSDRELRIEVQPNDNNYSRYATVTINAKSIHKEIHIYQEKRGGYSGLIDNYFDNLYGTNKITYFEINLYALGNYGLRLSSMMYRWKFVEVDLLNIDFQVYDQISVDWEPMIRGYLPFTGDGRCWAAYIGIGPRINFYESTWNKNENIVTTSISRSNVVFEIGTEFHWSKNDNTSSRMFIRYDGSMSLGFAFDLYEWK